MTRPRVRILLVILTEWNEFRALDLGRLSQGMAIPRMADLRNIYAAEDLQEAGFVAYTGVGRAGFGTGSGPDTGQDTGQDTGA
jgi:hypothetical protein